VRIHLQQNNSSSAIELLQQTTPYELRFSDHFGLEPAYIRGEAYVKARQGEQAAAEFRKLIDHSGIVGNSINGPPARLQLARAQVMGDKAAARKFSSLHDGSRTINVALVSWPESPATGMPRLS
jgi:hypothetical protein